MFPRRSRAALLVPFAAVLFGCQAEYLLRQAAGQWDVAMGQIPVSEVLAGEDLPKAKREKLLVVEEIRRFAVEELGLSLGKNYTTYYEPPSAYISYNVTACPEFSLEPVEWSFPIVGAVSYLGFFRKADALEEAARLRESGMSVRVRPVAAYSTLGWLTDPLVPSMLEMSEGHLANLLLHESTHSTVYRPGETSFNESFASFVGDEGALVFLERRQGKQSEEYQNEIRLRQDDQRLARHLHELCQLLEELYRSNRDGAALRKAKREILWRFRRDFVRFRQGFLTPGYRRIRWRWHDNADLVSYRIYHSGEKIFESVHRALQGNLREIIRFFRDLPAGEPAMKQAEVWIEQRHKQPPS